MNRQKIAGFALPTVLITSVAMMIVLLAALTSISSISVSIDNQYLNKVAGAAAESGVEMAKACIRKDGKASWSNASPLRPNSGCNGSASACSNVAACFVLQDGLTRSTFSVGVASVASDGTTYSISAEGSVEKVRASNGVVANSYRSSQNAVYRSTVVPTLASAGGFREKGHSAFLLAASGTIFGWGSNYAGQITNDNIENIPNPVKIALPSGYQRAEKIFGSGVGGVAICAILKPTSAGASKLFCRGSSAGAGLSREWAEYALPSGQTPSEVSINGYDRDTICVLTVQQSVYCAGQDKYGQFGRKSSTKDDDYFISDPQKYQLPSGINARKVFAQDSNTCVITTSNRAYCAGRNDAGQLGRGNTNSSDSATLENSTPREVSIPGNPNVLDIKISYHSGSRTLYFSTDNGLYITGSNEQGTANDDTTTRKNYSDPLKIANQNYDFIYVISNEGDYGLNSFCIGRNGTSTAAQCTGDRQYGQTALGTCSTTRTTGFNRLAYPGGNDLTFQAPSPNYDDGYHANSFVMIASDGNAYSAGDNQYGKLGTGAAMNTSCRGTLAKVLFPDADVKPIAVANGDEYSTYYLGNDRNVYAAGRNNNGQLGNGTYTDSNTAVKVKLPDESTTLF